MPWLPVAGRRGLCSRRRGGRPGQDQTAALRHAAPGVDLILAESTEAGGHTGEVATMVLVPVVVNLEVPPARAGPRLRTSLQLCVTVGYCGLP
jgi:hypothetical protein